ncbi:hypothetical protein C8T65DRAFT_832605 [Cerioporus squamosus]|nr:hypothetical protein C8T65DRAFT_832605 [Cerioporus squamosus]
MTAAGGTIDSQLKQPSSLNRHGQSDTVTTQVEPLSSDNVAAEGTQPTWYCNNPPEHRSPAPPLGSHGIPYESDDEVSYIARRKPPLVVTAPRQPISSPSKQLVSAPPLSAHGSSSQSKQPAPTPPLGAHGVPYEPDDEISYIARRKPPLVVTAPRQLTSLQHKQPAPAPPPGGHDQADASTNRAAHSSSLGASVVTPSSSAKQPESTQAAAPVPVY